ncbi:MAG: rhamnan synthesis F family protein, partial [Oscillospiraceae bacterium]|nr:rhamnan synthesis F family protein [Oscillospiraceae bacterium]
ALGLIFPKTYPPIAHHYSYGSNRENMIELFQRLGQNTKLPENLAFPSGNMFWAKTKAIRDIFTLRLKSSDFPEEKGQIDATLSHAIERSWVLLAESNGYKHREVSAEGF